MDEEFIKELTKCRTEVISGKISPELNKEVSKLIDGRDLKSRNDIVEKALLQFLWNRRKAKEVGEC